ncbi:MAG: hypothetical protein M3M94_06510 [Actinomycetota bacterium]|nr:hypothetical protein [Actinomycetota bacterium]
MTRLLVVLALVLAAVVVGAPALLGGVSGVRDKVSEVLPSRESSTADSGAQMSGAEFERIERDISPRELRAAAGEPESETRVRLEGRRLECWYYGIAEARGVYQLCFANGKLVSKLRY